MTEIPIEVLDALEEVRASGRTNMMARQTVIACAYEDGNYSAANWLADHDSDYMPALTEMGERRRAESGEKDRS